MFNSNGVSLADIAAVTGNNRNNDGMWGDGAWWIVILLIFGWGNNGWGGFGGNGNGAGYTDSAIQRGFDNQAVMEALDGLPPVKVHCSLLAEEAIHAALWDYAEKHNIKIEGLERPVNDISEKEEAPEEEY